MARIVVNCFVSQFQFQFRFAIGNSIKMELPRYEGRFIMFDLVSLADLYCRRLGLPCWNL